MARLLSRYPRSRSKKSTSSSSNASTTSTNSYHHACSYIYQVLRKCFVFLVVCLATIKTYQIVADELKNQTLFGTTKTTTQVKRKQLIPQAAVQQQQQQESSSSTDMVKWVTINATTIEFPTNGKPITAENHFYEFHERLDPHLLPNDRDNFCLPWTTNADEWWTHHPQWEIALGSENDTHYCFQIIQNQTKRQLYQDLYYIQFPIDDNNNNNNCTAVFTKNAWGSGWGADFSNLIDGMNHAMSHKHPVQIVEDGWHQYAGGHDGDKNHPAACPRENMFCYFLPFSSCKAAPMGQEESDFDEGFPLPHIYQWYYEYLTRQQTWLRKRIYDMIQSVNITAPCTVIHVRRSDVVLEDDMSRRYFPISEYINATTKLRDTILLLTDDQNAIEEALVEYPHLNWKYLGQPRYRGAEGGWQNHVPSNDPSFEVTALLAELQMATQYCNQIIRSTGSFSNLLHAGMRETGPFHASTGIDDVDIDEAYRRNGQPTNSKSHASTVNISRPYYTTINQN